SKLPKLKKKQRTPLPDVNQLLVEDGELRLHEASFETDVRLRLNSGAPTAESPHAPLNAKGEGSWRGYPFDLEGRVDSPLDLQNQERPYRADVRARAGRTQAHASGALRGQLQPENFDIEFDISGNTLGDLYRQTGIALPDSAPYRLNGRLNRQGDVWSYRKFTGKVGSSDIAGNASVDLGAERHMLKGVLTSKRLAFRDLLGFINVPPGASDEDIEAAKALKQAKPTVLPDRPFKLEKLRSIDADVSFEATHIDAPKLPLERMRAHLVLENGVLKINPLDFDAAGGAIASRLSLDARKATIQTTLITEVHKLELPKMFPTVQMTKSGAGLLSGAMTVTAQGNSVADMFASANGDIGLIMGEGHISNLLLELAGLDVAESVKYLFDKKHTIPLRCAYANFKIVDGQVTTRGLAFDTTDTIIFGEGNIDLRREAIGMRLIPQPKDKSPLSLRTPLQIGGTFKDPSFHPEAGPLILRTAAAAALYSVAPPAALLALIETGPGKDIDCGPARGS
ncbi:MAG: AsmA family protein, partial [Povalibacter sp.]